MNIFYKTFENLCFAMVLARRELYSHFHEPYVIGFVEDGERHLSCKNMDYTIGQGNVILFNPGDNHACVQADDDTLDYRGFNISKEIMLDLAEEVTGKRELPGFSENVIYDDEAICYLRPLHEMAMNNNSDFGKEENLLFLLSTLIQNYSQPFESCIPECRQETTLLLPRHTNTIHFVQNGNFAL